MGLDISPAKAKRFWTAVSQHWIRQANTDIGMFASVCLFSCRHVYLKMGAIHPEILETHAEMYKIALRENLTRCMAVNMRDKNILDDTITKMMALISDDVSLADVSFITCSATDSDMQDIIREHGTGPPGYGVRRRPCEPTSWVGR